MGSVVASADLADNAQGKESDFFNPWNPRDPRLIPVAPALNSNCNFVESWESGVRLPGDPGNPL